MYIEYTVSFWKEGNQIVGHAMPIDLMSCGYTEKEAEEELDEAVRILVDRAQDMGALEEILAECGHGDSGEGVPKGLPNSSHGCKPVGQWPRQF